MIQWNFNFFGRLPRFPLLPIHLLQFPVKYEIPFVTNRDGCNWSASFHCVFLGLLTWNVIVDIVVKSNYSVGIFLKNRITVFVRSWCWMGAVNRSCTWEEWFGLLVQYKTREGHCRVPPNYRTPDGYNLGKWLTNQKQKKRKGDLDPDLEIRMTDLGVKWRK